MKAIVITISIIIATAIVAMFGLDVWVGVQESDVQESADWEVVPEGSYATWSGIPPELNPKVSTTMYSQCQGLPTGNWYLFVCHIDGSSATCECLPNNELNASWDNEAWFQY